MARLINTAERYFEENKKPGLLSRTQQVSSACCSVINSTILASRLEHSAPSDSIHAIATKSRRSIPIVGAHEVSTRSGKKIVNAMIINLAHF
jgi:hypothetical protein